MRVITSKPIIYANAAGDETPTASATKERKPINPDVLKTGGEVLAGVATSLVNRQRQYTDAEQRCGKKPLGKKAREKWQKCVDSGVGAVAPMQNVPTTPETPTKAPMSKGLKIGLISGGVVLLGLIVFAIYKKSK
jgi:hypothetical protein